MLLVKIKYNSEWGRFLKSRTFHLSEKLVRGVWSLALRLINTRKAMHVDASLRMQGVFSSSSQLRKCSSPGVSGKVLQKIALQVITMKYQRLQELPFSPSPR